MPRPAVPAAILALLAWGALSLLWSVAPGRSAFVLGTMAALFLGFLLLRGAGLGAGADAPRRLGRAAVIAVILGLATIAWEAAIDLAVVKRLWPLLGQTPPATLVYLNYPLLVLAALLPLAVAHLATIGRWWAGALLVVAALSLAGGLESGTAILAIAATGGAFALFAVLPPRAVRLVSFAAVALALLVPPLLGKEIARFGPLVALTQQLGDSSRHRLAIWGGVSDLIRERPALGVGMGAARALPEGNAKVTVRDAQGRETSLAVELIPTHTHNAGLELAVELGLVGLALALLALMVGLRSAFAAARGRWPTAAVGMVGCGGAVLWSFGLSVWNAAYVAAWVIALAALAGWLAGGSGGDDRASGSERT